MKVKSICALGMVLLLFVYKVAPLCFAQNEEGHRTVVQYPTGTLRVEFEPGYYALWLGKATAYRDELVFDFSKETTSVEASVVQQGIDVRYRDDLSGTIYGVVHFELPTDEESMLDVHTRFHSESELSSTFLKVITEEIFKDTAGMFGSVEVYLSVGEQLEYWIHEQLKKGKYKVNFKELSETDGMTGMMSTKERPVLELDGAGSPIHVETELQETGITVTDYRILDKEFEQKVMEQISQISEERFERMEAKMKATREAYKEREKDRFGQ